MLCDGSFLFVSGYSKASFFTLNPGRSANRTVRIATIKNRFSLFFCRCSGSFNTSFTNLAESQSTACHHSKLSAWWQRSLRKGDYSYLF